MNRFLLTLFIIITSSVSLLAQENRTFIIYDATGIVDNNGNYIQIVDSDNGRPMREMGLSLNQLDGDVIVYVTFKRWAQIIINSLTNNQNQEEVQAFFQFYDNNDAYRLQSNFSRIYNTQGARAIGERLKNQFPNEIAEWEEKDSEFSKDELALIIVKSPFLQEYFPLEWIEQFEPNNEISECPIYYTGKLKIAESETKFVRKIDFEEAAIQVGNEIRFNEVFNISGPSNKRLIIDRFVEVCTFEKDYNRLYERMVEDSIKSTTNLNNVRRSKKLKDVLGHLENNFRQKYREVPYVFPGVKFERLLKRRMSGDISRDTLEQYRILTKKAFSNKNYQKDFYEVTPDTVEFRIDYNLFNRYLSKYRTFWSISPVFAEKLPADGGITYDDTASLKLYYNIRTDVETFNKVREYIENGRHLKGSSDYIVEGFVPSIYTIRARHNYYSEYWISNSLNNDLKKVDEYKNLVDTKKIINVREENGGHRIRLESSNYSKLLNIIETVSLGDESFYLTEKPIIDTVVLSWTMPDPNLYYTLKHVNYLHDFMTADTTMTECNCTRTNPLRFLSVPTEAALPDCPPLINGRYYEDYKPKSKTDDPQSVDIEARLAFEQNSYSINSSLGENYYQLDSLKRVTDEILGRTSSSVNSISHRIDTITILGISSPEGQYERNLELAHRRSESLVNWVKVNCGVNNVITVYIDSVASWNEVGQMVNLSAGEAETAYHEGNEDVLAALESMRKVQLKFVYTALLEPNESTILEVYKTTKNADIYGPYYYYTLFNSNYVSHEEKLKLAKEVVNHGSNDDFINSHDVNRANSEHWYDLIKPIAANMLAIENIRQKKWDTSILAPFIDVQQGGNSTSFSQGHLINNEVPKAYKYVNADFVLYNQIQMLLGLGTSASLQTADSLLQILSVTSYSPKFEVKYQPSRLVDLLECYRTSSFGGSSSLTDRIKNSNIVNMYVMNMAIAHDIFFNTGSYNNPNITLMFTECHDSLSVLNKLPDDKIEKYYFKAITIARYADMTIAEDRNEQLLDAINTLADMFMVDESMISNCQGDRYIREIYRTPALRQKGIDIYLEAVEEYIKRWLEVHEE